MMAQNEQTTEEHSTLEQQSPGRLDHPAYGREREREREKFIYQVHNIDTIHIDCYNGRLPVEALTHRSWPPITKKKHNTHILTEKKF